MWTTQHIQLGYVLCSLHSQGQGCISKIWIYQYRSIVYTFANIYQTICVRYYSKDITWIHLIFTITPLSFPILQVKKLRDGGGGVMLYAESHCQQMESKFELERSDSRACLPSWHLCDATSIWAARALYSGVNETPAFKKEALPNMSNDNTHLRKLLFLP